MSNIRINTTSLNDCLSYLKTEISFFKGKKAEYGRVNFGTSESARLNNYLKNIGFSLEKISGNLEEIKLFLEDYIADVEGVENKLSNKGGNPKTSTVISLANACPKISLKKISEENLFKISSFQASTSSSKKTSSSTKDPQISNLNSKSSSFNMDFNVASTFGTFSASEVMSDAYKFGESNFKGYCDAIKSCMENNDDKHELLAKMLSATVMYSGSVGLATGEKLELKGAHDNEYWNSLSDEEKKEVAYKELMEYYKEAKEKGYTDILETYEKVFGKSVLNAFISQNGGTIQEFTKIDEIGQKEIDTGIDFRSQSEILSIMNQVYHSYNPNSEEYKKLYQLVENYQKEITANLNVYEYAYMQTDYVYDKGADFAYSYLQNLVEIPEVTAYLSDKGMKISDVIKSYKDETSFKSILKELLEIECISRNKTIFLEKNPDYQQYEVLNELLTNVDISQNGEIKCYENLFHAYFQAKNHGYKDIINSFIGVFGLDIINYLDEDYEKAAQYLAKEGLDIHTLEDINISFFDNVENLFTEENIQHKSIDEINNFINCLDAKTTSINEMDIYLDDIYSLVDEGKMSFQEANNYLEKINSARSIASYYDFTNNTLTNKFNNMFTYANKNEIKNIPNSLVFQSPEEYQKNISQFDNLEYSMAYNNGKKSYFDISYSESILPSTIVHESIHHISRSDGKIGVELLEDNKWKYIGLNETFTEYLTEYIMQEDYSNYSGYTEAVDRLDEFIKLGVLDNDMIQKSYFTKSPSAVMQIKNAFNEVGGWTKITNLFDKATSSDYLEKGNALAELDTIIETIRLNRL